jgi:hypothetical protein
MGTNVSTGNTGHLRLAEVERFWEFNKLWGDDRVNGKRIVSQFVDK